MAINVGAALAAGVGAGGSIMTSGLNYLFNRKLAKYQYELDQQAIDRQNAYNSPVQQMARYKEAGLNPNMIYGSGGSAGNQTEVARFDAPRVNFENPLQGAISTYFDARLKTAQEEHLIQRAYHDSLEVVFRVPLRIRALPSLSGTLLAE